MNKKGFTLIELIATIVVLGIVVGLTVYTVNASLEKAKSKTEDVFVGTLVDAIQMYLDTDAKRLSGNDYVGTITKTHGYIKLYRIGTVSFNDIINSSMNPIEVDDFVNPANENGNCKDRLNTEFINIYRDDDYVYYYKFNKENLGDDCFTTTGAISNLPEYN